MSPASTTPLTDLVSGAAGVVVVLSGVIAGIARAYAVLIGASPDRIERATAIGFLIGAALAALLLFGNLLSEVDW
jgi:membrane associated rhomboid family serine protease